MAMSTDDINKAREWLAENQASVPAAIVDTLEESLEYAMEAMLLHMAVHSSEES